MSDVYDIWLYPLQDWWETVDEMSNFMSTGQMGNFIFCPVFVPFWTPGSHYFHRYHPMGAMGHYAGVRVDWTLHLQCLQWVFSAHNSFFSCELFVTFHHIILAVWHVLQILQDNYWRSIIWVIPTVVVLIVLPSVVMVMFIVSAAHSNGFGSFPARLMSYNCSYYWSANGYWNVCIMPNTFVWTMWENTISINSRHTSHIVTHSCNAKIKWQNCGITYW